MKTKLLILFIALGLVTGACKKDKETESAQSLIVGKWITVTESYDYYDAQGRKIYSDPASELDGPGIKLEFKSDNTFNIISGSDVENGIYNVFTADNKTYIKFPDSFELKQVEVKSVSKQQMVWLAEYSNERYTENGQIKTSAKSAYTLTLNRQ